MIDVVGGMDRALNLGFMTVVNFMAEVKVRISFFVIQCLKSSNKSDDFSEDMMRMEMVS